ncbi:hypothetical protein V502_09861, partial [Pseudogymnoascus sp. VKM F-4520 (FW-2644)]
MPPPNKFTVAHTMPITIPAHVDAEAEAQTLAEYNSLSGSAKSKLLAKLAYARGTVVTDTACPRYTSQQQLPKFEHCVVNETLFPAGYCCSCAWAGDAHKCNAVRAQQLYARFEVAAETRANRIIAAYHNGTFALVPPHDTINGTMALLESIMADNSDDRLRQ